MAKILLHNLIFKLEFSLKIKSEEKNKQTIIYLFIFNFTVFKKLNSTNQITKVIIII